MTVQIDRFQDGDLAGVLQLCDAEAWPSFLENPARSLRALTAPGVTTVVARDGDGVIQGYLAAVAVAAHRREEGIGTALIESAVTLGGGQRIDLLTDNGATGFYDRLPHRRKNGYRLYPPLDEH